MTLAPDGTTWRCGHASTHRPLAPPRELAEQVRALKQQSPDPLRSIGSITLVRSLLRLGLVGRLRLTIFPLLLGDAGREPVYPDLPQARLELVDTTVLDSRLVMVEYRPTPVR